MTFEELMAKESPSPIPEIRFLWEEAGRPDDLGAWSQDLGLVVNEMEADLVRPHLVIDGGSVV